MNVETAGTANVVVGAWRDRSELRGRRIFECSCAQGDRWIGFDTFDREHMARCHADEGGALTPIGHDVMRLSPYTQESTA